MQRHFLGFVLAVASRPVGDANSSNNLEEINSVGDAAYGKKYGIVGGGSDVARRARASRAELVRACPLPGIDGAPRLPILIVSIRLWPLGGAAAACRTDRF